MNRISTFALALIALFAFDGARAATSIPIPEAGFALASNNGSDAIATPMSNDMGGGTSRSLRGSEVAVETPDRDSSNSEAAGNAAGREEHAQKAAPADSASNSSTTTRKSRGNAHWQALLPGLMR